MHLLSLITAFPQPALTRHARLRKNFFKRPLEEKIKCSAASPFENRGYLAYEAENVYAFATGKFDKPGDPVEKYAIGPVTIPNDPWFTDPKAGRTFSPNIWPNDSFKDCLTEYYNHQQQLANHLLSAFALALGLPISHFQNKTDKCAVIKFNFYPKLPHAKPGQEHRMYPHTDASTLSIVKDDQVPGLKIMTRSGEWLAPQYVPNSFFVNLGDLMAVWTNDKWVSTKHYVELPDSKEHSERLSVVFFGAANYDTVIECIPSCKGDGAKHPPILYGDWLKQKLSLLMEGFANLYK